MTLQQVKQQYIKYSNSISLKDRMRAEGYSLVIEEYLKSPSNNEYYEDVRISLIAESLLDAINWLYNKTKKEIYKWQGKGIRDCIIDYISDRDLSNLISKYNGDLTETAIFNFINKTTYKGKVKYASVHSLCEVMKLSLKE
jgi:hypothetical protein